MRKPYSKVETPLLEILRQLPRGKKQELANRAGTSVNYLYQLGICHRKQPRTTTAMRIVNALNDMHVESLGAIPKITLEELATMCPVDVGELL